MPDAMTGKALLTAVGVSIALAGCGSASTPAKPEDINDQSVQDEMTFRIAQAIIDEPQSTSAEVSDAHNAVTTCVDAGSDEVECQAEMPNAGRRMIFRVSRDSDGKYTSVSFVKDAAQ